MKLTSDFVGATLKEYICHINARRTMNYAAAIGDANPLYFNDERPEGIIAPPLFPVALTWPIVENITDYLDAPGFPRRSFSLRCITVSTSASTGRLNLVST